MPLFFNYLVFVENIFNSYESGPYSPTVHITPNSPEYSAPTHARTYRGAPESDMDCWDGIIALKKKKTLFLCGRGGGEVGDMKLKRDNCFLCACVFLCVWFFFFCFFFLYYYFFKGLPSLSIYRFQPLITHLYTSHRKILFTPTPTPTHTLSLSLSLPPLLLLSLLFLCIPSLHLLICLPSPSPFVFFPLPPLPQPPSLSPLSVPCTQSYNDITEGNFRHK